jgi:hypothetical protein
MLAMAEPAGTAIVTDVGQAESEAPVVAELYSVLPFPAAKVSQIALGGHWNAVVNVIGPVQKLVSFGPQLLRTYAW